VGFNGKSTGAPGGEHFLFDLVFILKNNQINFLFLKKIKTETELKPVQTN
jgi:hypothetical protein